MENKIKYRIHLEVDNIGLGATFISLLKFKLLSEKNNNKTTTNKPRMCAKQLGQWVVPYLRVIY